MLTFGAGQGPLDQKGEEGPIGQPREAVVLGHVADALRQLVPGRDVAGHALELDGARPRLAGEMHQHLGPDEGAVLAGLGQLGAEGGARGEGPGAKGGALFREQGLELGPALRRQGRIQGLRHDLGGGIAPQLQDGGADIQQPAGFGIQDPHHVPHVVAQGLELALTGGQMGFSRVARRALGVQTFLGRPEFLLEPLGRGVLPGPGGGIRVPPLGLGSGEREPQLAQQGLEGGFQRQNRRFPPDLSQSPTAARASGGHAVGGVPTPGRRSGRAVMGKSWWG